MFLETIFIAELVELARWLTPVPQSGLWQKALAKSFGLHALEWEGRKFE